MFFNSRGNKVILNKQTSLKLSSIIQRLENQKAEVVDKIPGLTYGYFSEGEVLYGWKGGLLIKLENGKTYTIKDDFLVELAQKWVLEVPENWEETLKWLSQNDLIDE